MTPLYDEYSPQSLNIQFGTNFSPIPVDAGPHAPLGTSSALYGFIGPTPQYSPFRQAVSPVSQ
ncbi:hypothetical protein J6590_053889 [Homalodisca vitripennis]|nr:hypothetical protein J6590_053889 [Homalodisca vitripennis]